MWKEDIFEIGKQVLLSTRNLQDLAAITKQATRVTKTTTRKLMPLYIGPYTIKSLRGPLIKVPGTDPELMRQVTVELDLPKYFDISPIRHCSELRPFYDEEFNPVTTVRTPPQTAKAVAQASFTQSQDALQTNATYTKCTANMGKQETLNCKSQQQT